MKLIFLYGPPGVGKLTVAQELSKISDWKVLDIHSVMDVMMPIFGRNHPVKSKLTRQIRLMLVEGAAQAGIPGLIFTYGYAKQSADEFIKNLIETIKKYNGEIYFVRLVADRAELERRVVSVSRQFTGKVKSVEHLEQALTDPELDFYRIIPFVETETIDTTHLSAQQVAQMIKEKYKV